MPNIDYTELFKLTEPERKGLMYGSLISAILGAGVGVLSGESAGESIARGLHAGATAYSQGYQNLEDYKKLIYSAIRQQEADRMAQEEWELRKQNLLAQQEREKEWAELADTIVGEAPGIHIPSQYVGIPKSERNLLGKPTTPTLGEGIGFYTPEINIPGEPITLTGQVASRTGIPAPLVRQIIRSGNIAPLINLWLKATTLPSPRPSVKETIIEDPETGKQERVIMNMATGEVVRRLGKPLPPKGTGGKSNSLDEPIPEALRRYAEEVLKVPIKQGITHRQFNAIFGKLPVKSKEQQLLDMTYKDVLSNYRYIMGDSATKEQIWNETWQRNKKILGIENDTEQTKTPRKPLSEFFKR